MSNTLQTLLPLIGLPSLAGLVSPLARERIERYAANLPILSGGLLECPLTEASQQVDLALRANQRDGDFKWLADPVWLAKEASGLDAWRRIQCFAQNHGSPEHALLNKAVSEAWLEFDLDDNGRALAAPNFFFKLESHFGRPPLLGSTVAARMAETMAVIKDALSALDSDFKPSNLDVLERHIRLMPAASSLSYIGVMLPRGQAAYRLTFNHMPLSELTAFLRALDWPHDRKPIAGMIEFLLNHVQHVVLHLDVADTTLQRIGFEVSFEKERDQYSSWRLFLDDLVGQGLCQPNKAEDALAWPEQFGPNTGKLAWPSSLPPHSSHFTRSINHVKLSYDAGPAVEKKPSHGLPIQMATTLLTAKIYLAFNYGTTIPRTILSPK